MTAKERAARIYPKPFERESSVPSAACYVAIEAAIREAEKAMKAKAIFVAARAKDQRQNVVEVMRREL